MANDMFKLVAVIAIAWLFLGQNGGTPTGGTTDSTPISCGVEPTFTLLAADKYDEDVNVGVSHSYRKNGGTLQTYSSAVTAKVGDTIDVLWGAGNVTIYNNKDTFTVTDCGVNDFQNRNMVQNTTITMECFNDENSLIDDTTTNLTLGSGESWTTDCRLRIANAQTGMPHGGVLVVEAATGTVWEEEVFAVTGGVIGGTTNVPSAHTVSAAANKAMAWNVDPILGTGNKGFDVYIKADTGQNPGITNDVTMYLYANDCYDDGEAGDFKCGITDEDNGWTGGEVGREIIQVD